MACHLLATAGHKAQITQGPERLSAGTRWGRRACAEASDNLKRETMNTTQSPTELPAAPCSLTIAIDFDHTWTADPHGWRAWYDLMTSRGHIVILATGRSGWSDDLRRANLPHEMPVVFCGREMKEHAAKKQGWLVNIWIDDMPGMIQDCRILRVDLSSANDRTERSADNAGRSQPKDSNGL